MASYNSISMPSLSATAAIAATGSDNVSSVQGSSTSIDSLKLNFQGAIPQSLENRGSKTIPQAQQQHMFSSLNAVFERAEEVEGGIGVSELRAASETADDIETGGNELRALGDVRGILDQMWWCNSNFLITAAEVLADGSREHRWRIPFGQTGILDFFIAVIGTEGIEDDLMMQALRLIGNSCADTDQNRQRLIDSGSVPALMRQLSNAAVLRIAVPALFNLCTDFEPAQQQAVSTGLVHELISLLSSGSFGEDPLLGHISRTLELLLSVSQASISAPDDSVEILLKVILEPTTPLSDYLILINCCVLLLQDDRFQSRLITRHCFEIPLTVLVESYSRFSSSEEQASITATRSQSEDEQLLHQMRDSFIHVLSDVSALPEFATTYPLQSPLIGSLRLWLTVPQLQLQTCACVMLGNIARSDDICRTMVQELHIHETLIDILEESFDSQVLHAAAGFLKNLVVLIENRVTVAETRIIQVLARLWSMGTLPQIQYAGVSLLRQLVSGSYKNVLRLLASLSADPDSPAHSRTYLSLLLRLYEKTDQVATRTEIARAVTAICRVLSSTDSSLSADELRETLHRFYSLHEGVARPLASMVSQSQWPVVRSEGWFAFALMAKNEEGAAAVSQAMQNVSVVRPLVETVTGKSFNAQDALQTPEMEVEEKQLEMKRRDKENAMLLISELLKFRGETMAILRRNFFEDLLQGRESVHVTYRELLKLADSVNTI